MKIKDGFMLRQFGDSYIVVAVGDDSENFNKLITINSVGAFIYKLLSEDRTRDEIVKAMLEKYDVSEEIAVRDCDAYITNLKTAGLLDD
ncbi:MAG: PqqD family protein [Clostridia bacterium]|nr:PqqD family protein [Ruminococcus sp.]MBR0088236.1 PqqD family protein [Clostridia bacterium]